MVCTDDDVERARFFPDVRLNYAENLLRPLPGVDDDAARAHLACTPHRGRRAVLPPRAADRRGGGRRRAGPARRSVPADRVAVIAPNHAGAVVTSLAVAAVGGTLSTVTPDMGATALIGRLEQVEPVLLVVDRTRMTDDGDCSTGCSPACRRCGGCSSWTTIPCRTATGLAVDRLSRLAAEVDGDRGRPWPRLPFNHPLWVMFSSGTTGPPKAMVHGAGGSLLEHVKEHRLHGDLRPDDVLYFHTTTAWMMWNWQLSALAVGAHVVALRRAGQRAGDPVASWSPTTASPSSAPAPPYLQLCQDAGYRPATEVDLGRAARGPLHRRRSCTTGSSTGCRGGRAGAAAVDLRGHRHRRLLRAGPPGAPGASAAAASRSASASTSRHSTTTAGPSLGAGRRAGLPPSVPVPSAGLPRATPTARRFHDAYFADHAGMWTHGDLITIDAGRVGADARPLRRRAEHQRHPDRSGGDLPHPARPCPRSLDAHGRRAARPGGDSRLLLLVVLRPAHRLDDELAARIRARLRTEGSAAHVPQVVVPVDELPTTHNGKRSERAARDAVNGAAVRNLAALKNPGSLDAIRDAVARRRSAPPQRRRPASRTPADLVTAAVSPGLPRRPRRCSSLDHTANFFDLGGTSRQSMTILRRLRNELRPPGAGGRLPGRAHGGGLAAELRRPAQVGRARFPVMRRRRRDRAAAVPRARRLRRRDGYRGLCEHLDTRATVHGIEGSLIDHRRAGEDHPRRSPPSTSRSCWPSSRPARSASPGSASAAWWPSRWPGSWPQAGRTPEHLALLDVRPPKGSLTRFENILRKASTLIALVIPAFHDRTLGQALRDRFRKSRARRPTARPLRGGVAVYDDYRWERYDGAVTYFRARVRLPVIMCLLFAWRRAAPHLRVVDVPGEHDDLLDAHHAQRLAQRMSEALRG